MSKLERNLMRYHSNATWVLMDLKSLTLSRFAGSLLILTREQRAALRAFCEGHLLLVSGFSHKGPVMRKLGPIW